MNFLSKIVLGCYSYVKNKMLPLFAEKISPWYEKLLKKHHYHPGLLNQVKINVAEKKISPSEHVDPMRQSSHLIGPIIQRYQERALLLLNSHCPAHCRYCFRKNFSYPKNLNTDSGIKQIIKTLENLSNIKEVILSGGEPLTQTDNYINHLLKALNEVKKIKRIRIHSRIFTFVPNRITKNLKNILSQIPSPKGIFVTHFNHPLELDEEILPYINKVKQSGLVMYNQSVLLKGINNQLNTLIDLSEKLWDFGIQPYYLHKLDLAPGTKHFCLSQTEISDLYQNLCSALSGFLVPTLVEEDKISLFKKRIF